MISVNDVSDDLHEAPSYMMIHVKTDPFDTGFILQVGHTRDELSPVAAMLSYLARRLPDPGFLFLFHDGTPLSWDCLCQELRLAFQAAGVNASGYSGPE